MTALFSKFSSCSLQPIDDGKELKPPPVDRAKGVWKTSAFYLDSSGRATVVLPLRLFLASEDLLEDFVASRCLPVLEESTVEQETLETSNRPRVFFAIESKVTLTVGSGEAVSAAVEEVQVVSAKVANEQCSIDLQTHLHLRVTRHIERTNQDTSNVMGPAVKTTLEIGATLTERSDIAGMENAISQDLAALSMGGVPTFAGRRPHHRRFREVRVAPPISLQVALTHAIEMETRSHRGRTLGETFVALTIRHANTHARTVLVTDVSLHPGLAELVSDREDDMRPMTPAGSRRTLDMSKVVRWKLADINLKLPLRLKPYEAYSTLLAVHADDDTAGHRSFCSPLVATAVIDDGHPSPTFECQVMVAASVRWTTNCAVSENWKLELRTPPPQNCVVGALVDIEVQLFNLTSQAEEACLKLELPDDADHVAQFHVHGLENRHESISRKTLLPVDREIPLGLVKAHDSATALLRIILLQAGLVKIPDLYVEEAQSGRMFHLKHCLQILAADDSGSKRSDTTTVLSKSN